MRNRTLFGLVLVASAMLTGALLSFADETAGDGGGNSPETGEDSQGSEEVAQDAENASESDSESTSEESSEVEDDNPAASLAESGD